MDPHAATPPPKPPKGKKKSKRFRRRRTTVFQRLRNYLLTGILVSGPLVITVWLTITVVNFFDNISRSWLPIQWQLETYLPVALPGLGMATVLVGLVLIGFLTANLVGRLFLNVLDRMVARLPVVNRVYTTIKQIFDTILSQRSSAFHQVVLIEYPRRGMWSLAFLTGDSPKAVQGQLGNEILSIFLPTTPNPTSGFLLYLPKKDVVFLDLSVEEGVKLVFSFGIVKPPTTPEEEEAFASALPYLAPDAITPPKKGA